MTNIFKNAKFGDTCICNNGKQVIFLYQNEHTLEAKLMGKGCVDYIGTYNLDGTCKAKDTDYDIVQIISKQTSEESIDSHIQALVDAGYHGDLRRCIGGSSDSFERTEVISM